MKIARWLAIPLLLVGVVTCRESALDSPATVESPPIPGGLLVSGDAMRSSAPALKRAEIAGWIAHMRRTYSAREASGFLAAWAGEDRYMPLAVEVALLRSAGFRVDVPWRRAPFAVVAATRP